MSNLAVGYSPSELAQLHACTAARAAATAGPRRPTMNKRRCWMFHVVDVKRDVQENNLLLSFRERYTTIKRLVISPTQRRTDDAKKGRDMLVEVQFSGPQPSEGPGALLCALLCGSSFEAQPVELARGRKKRSRTAEPIAAAAGEGGGVVDIGLRATSTGGTSTNNVMDMDEEADNVIGDGLSPQPAPALSILLPADPSQSTQMPITVLGDDGERSTRSHVSTNTLIDLDDETDDEHDDEQSAGGELCATPTHGQVKPCDASESPAMNSGGKGDDPVARCPPPGLDGGGSTVAQPAVDLVDQGLRIEPFEKFDSCSSPYFDAPLAGSVAADRNHAGVGIGEETLCGGSNARRQGGNEGILKSTFEPLLLSPALSPQTVQPPQRAAGWSLESVPKEDEDELGNSWNMIMDTTEVDDFFRSAEAGEAGSSDLNAPAGLGVEADVGAGGAHGATRLGSKCSQHSSGSSMEDVVIELSRKECDFAGHAVPVDSAIRSGPVATVSAEYRCLLVFTGLERTGHDLRKLAVTAHFGVDTGHKTARAASPIQVGANGKFFAEVSYPSMQELWPELHRLTNVRVIEVDVMVEIRSAGGEFHYAASKLKVTYIRSPAPTDQGKKKSGTSSCRRFEPRTGKHQGQRVGEDSPHVTYSAIDSRSCCTDWFTVFRSVFGTASTAHEPLGDDEFDDDLMSVDAL